MRKILFVIPLALAACSSTAPATQQQVQANAAKALWYLQSAGCVAATLAGAAAPVVSAVSDAKGNAVLSAVGAGATPLCTMTVPAASVAP